jgi:hypothetical protein
MREVTVTATVDMREISTIDLIRALEHRNLHNFEIERLKDLVGYDFIPENFNMPTTLDEARKLDVIMANMGNKSYLEICSFFEGPLPFEK